MKNKFNQISGKELKAVDSPPLSEEILARLQPVAKTHPNIPPRVRGPQKYPTKIPVSLRLSPQVIEYFKSMGKGWQTHLDKVLCEYITSHK
jgi:uncharacterized protein (DUF4415 family)